MNIGKNYLNILFFSYQASKDIRKRLSSVDISQDRLSAISFSVTHRIDNDWSFESVFFYNSIISRI